MHGLALLVLLFAEHDATHWEMSCDEWNQARIEILSDENHIQDAKEYLIDYFYTKVQKKIANHGRLDASKPTRNGSFILVRGRKSSLKDRGLKIQLL